MIFTLMIVVFIIGYAAIALEHPIKVDKAASALIIGGLGWALFAFSGVDHHTLTHEIQHHIVDIAEILFFLLGAAYHRAKGTMEMLKRLRVPVTMLGPYSYDAAPCELFFAAFKRADVNPNNKRHSDPRSPGRHLHRCKRKVAFHA